MKAPFIEFKDLLDGDLVNVDGLDFDAKIHVVVCEKPNGDIEIDSFEMGEIYVHHPVYDTILLDQGSIPSTLKLRFVNLCELKALERASKASPTKWVYEIEEEEAV